jgi:hypothetical protein
MRKNVRTLCALGLGWLVSPACSGVTHDCSETRTCPEPIGYIDAGNFDDWWDAGAAGQSALPGDPAAAAGAGGEAGSSTDAGASGKSGGTQGGASGESGASAERGVISDTAELNVLSVSPADGAAGVASDAELVLRFSCPISAAAFAAAYRSFDLPAAQVTFSWDATRTVLTMKPNAPLAYAASNVLAGEAVTAPAKVYHYGFSDLRCDAPGSPPTARDFSFSTLRQISTVLSADPFRTGNWTDGEGEGIHNCLRSALAPYAPSVCVGDDSNNVRYTGFISFDLSGIPPQMAAFSSARLLASATLYGSPSALGPSQLEHVAFADLGAAALAVPSSADLGAFYVDTGVTSGGHFSLAVDVTSAVASDFAMRSVGSSFTQFRLTFAQISANYSWDDIELPTSGLRLSLVYLVP